MMPRRYVAYQWLSSPSFLLPALLPSILAVEASPQDDPEAIMEAIGAADWFHFHLNCTRTARFPLGRDELLGMLQLRGITTVNADVVDISKRRVQRTCAALGLNQVTALPHGDPDEQLFIKTDLNFGGDSEWALSNDERERLALGEGSSVMWKPNDYRILRRAEVPEAWWTDPTLVCERFVGNGDDRWYRVFLFLDRMVVCELVDPSDIKKVGHSTVSGVRMMLIPKGDALDGVDALARDVARFAQALHVEFGAIDVVVDDAGAPHIIDLNTTPAYNYPVDGLVDFLRLALNGER